jgi:hypothetical protein
MKELRASIVHWRQLATDEKEWAEHEKRHGDVSSFHHRANLYERTAQALEIELETGMAVCVCCHKPFSEGPRVSCYGG